MGQLARGVEWAADESGVELRALSTTEAARLLAELAADEAFASADAFEMPGDFGVPLALASSPMVDDSNFGAPDFGGPDFGGPDVDDSDREDGPATQRSPLWDPMADAPISAHASSAQASHTNAVTTDDVSTDHLTAFDDTFRAAPPFVRSLLTVW